MGALYQIEFPNGKSYIGITVKTAEKRFRNHIYDSRRKDKGIPLHRAIRKYWESNCFVRTLVIANDWTYLSELERKAIVAFGTKVPHGYNASDGGDGAFGVVKSAETRALLSRTLRGRKWTPERLANYKSHLKGVALSDEHKAKIGAATRGHTLSAEGREKVAAKKRGIPRSVETKDKLRLANLGKKHSAEARAKMSVKQSAKTMSPEARVKMSAARHRWWARKRGLA